MRVCRLMSAQPMAVSFLALSGPLPFLALYGPLWPSMVQLYSGIALVIVGEEEAAVFLVVVLQVQVVQVRKERRIDLDHLVP